MNNFSTHLVHLTHRSNKAKWLSFLFGLFLVQSGISQPFISTWRTDYSGSSNETSITIPTQGEGYNYNVDWNNDGTFDELGLTGAVTHNFGKSGAYTIRIEGSFPRIYFNNGGDKNKLQSIEQWGSIKWASMENAFYGCSNLSISAQDAPDLSNVSSMAGMFREAGVSIPAIGNWDVSNILLMDRLFENSAFNQNLGRWNISKY